jgi:hypothetical protein
VPSRRQALAVVTALLVLTACTRIYFKDFAVDPQDSAYTANAQFKDIRSYLVARGLRIVTESEGFIAVDLETQPGGAGRRAPSDNLQVRVIANQVELTLVRRSAGADFSAEQLKVFQQALERRLRESSGQVVSVRLVGERVSPLTNVRLQ